MTAHDPLTCELCHAEGVTAEIQALRAALEEIANRPTVERNPDGDDQAAFTMQLIAREALNA